jgi:hypothetical protein
LSVSNPSHTQFLVAFAIDAIVGGAVWIHADRNGIRHQTAWALFVVFFLLVALPIYVLYVRRVRRERGDL